MSKQEELEVKAQPGMKIEERDEKKKRERQRRLQDKNIRLACGLSNVKPGRGEKKTPVCLTLVWK